MARRAEWSKPETTGRKATDDSMTRVDEVNKPVYISFGVGNAAPGRSIYWPLAAVLDTKEAGEDGTRMDDYLRMESAMRTSLLLHLFCTRT
jgi:hypothetical protein